MRPASYMPVCLMMRAVGVDWVLPRTELPANLPSGLDRKGLFQIKPKYDYLRVTIGQARKAWG